MKEQKPVHCESKDITDQARDTKASLVYPQAKTKNTGNMDQRYIIFFFLFCFGLKLSISGKILCFCEWCV